jgi:hypothetical protein
MPEQDPACLCLGFLPPVKTTDHQGKSDKQPYSECHAQPLALSIEKQSPGANSRRIQSALPKKISWLELELAARLSRFVLTNGMERVCPESAESDTSPPIPSSNI